MAIKGKAVRNVKVDRFCGSVVNRKTAANKIRQPVNVSFCLRLLSKKKLLIKKHCPIRLSKATVGSLSS